MDRIKRIKRKHYKRLSFWLAVGFVMVQAFGGSGIKAEARDGFSFTSAETAEVERVVKSCGSGISVFYQDIQSGYTYTYNAQRKYFIASVIKAPYCMYIYDLASQGKCDLEKRYTYSLRHKADGTGKIQYMKTGTQFTMRQLLQYAIKYSDNVAMRMIREAYPVSGYKNFAKEIGITNLGDIKNATNGVLCAKDAGIYISAIYRFIQENPYGGELKSLMSQTTNPMIVSSYPVVRKYGWAEKSFHDIAVIEAPRPYLLCILSDHDGDFKSFSKISKVIEKYSQKAGGLLADPSFYAMMYDGMRVPAAVFDIDGSTYVSIREMEALLKGTDRAIQLSWKSNALYIQKIGKETDGHTMRLTEKEAPMPLKQSEAVKKKHKIYWEGKGTLNEAYQINGRLYLKLRDVCDALDIKLKVSAVDKLITLSI